MKIALFGNNTLVDQLILDFTLKRDEILHIYHEKDENRYREERGIDLLLYNRYEDVSESKKLRECDSFLFMDEREEENLFLAAALSHYQIPSYVLIHNREKATFIANHSGNFPHMSLLCPSYLYAHRADQHFYENGGIVSEVYQNFKRELLEYDVNMEQEFVGRRIKNIGALEDLVLVGIKRRGNLIVPDGNEILEEGDILQILGTIPAMSRFKRRHFTADFFDTEHKRFIIYGLTEEALAIGTYFSRKGADVTYMAEREINRKNQHLYLEEGTYYSLDRQGVGDNFTALMKGADGFLAFSQADEKNIYYTILAEERGVKNAIPYIQDSSIIGALDPRIRGIIFSRNFILSSELSRRIHGPGELSLYIYPGAMEIYEVLLKGGAPAVGRSIESLDLPRGFLIGAILRGEEEILPRGNTLLKEGDMLLLFMTQETSHELSKFLVKEPKSNFLTDLLNLY